MEHRFPLPIDPYLPKLVSLWEKHSTVIVKASPGSGKTTRLPWELAKNSHKKVLVLEPRRLAAKLAAQRIAAENNLRLGKEVGFHFRFERSHSAETKLIFYTEGTFLRLLLGDPEIADVGTVILDEFHERHIETDVALAALRGLQERRPELKIVLMSATLDAALGIAFPDAHTVEIEARQFKVDLHYLPNQPSVLNQSLETKVKRTLTELPADSGDVLVFVPGMREMLRTKDHLGSQFGAVYLLHADLSKEEQEEALADNEVRKIILATNIAESSITIPGIKVVIDSGIQREAKYSPWTGLKTLEDRPITQSSAIQRAGRAGRTSDGACYRLYAEQDFNNWEPFTVPEILRADLTDTYLLTTRFAGTLSWFTPPPAERWEKSRELAYKLGAVDEKGAITSTGEEMLKLPLGARLSRTFLAGKELVLSEKKRLLNYVCESIEKDTYGILKRRLNFFLTEGKDPGPWEKALLRGFIDQVARFRQKQHDFIHYSGKTLKAHASLKNLHHDYYLVLDVTQRLEAITVVPIEEEWLYDVSPFPFTEEELFDIGERFQIKRQTKLGSIVLEESPVKLEWTALSPAAKNKIKEQSESLYKKKWESWQQTETFLRLHYLARTQNRELTLPPLTKYFEEYDLTWQHLEHYFATELGADSVESLLPTKINLGGKRDLKVHYPYGLEPFVEAHIQEFYGVTTTPTIMGGKIPLLMKLLGPHKRPIQVTKDIQGFWKKTYPEMKKEWQREYPRHHWPEAPEKAPPILLKRQL